MCWDKVIPQKQTGLKDFETFEELESWFDLHKELRMPEPNLCDDYSRESRALAEADGYFLSLCLVAGGIAYTTTIFPDASVFHVGNMAIVASTQEVWYVDLAFGLLIRLCQFYPGGAY